MFRDLNNAYEYFGRFSQFQAWDPLNHTVVIPAEIVGMTSYIRKVGLKLPKQALDFATPNSLFCNTLKLGFGF